VTVELESEGDTVFCRVCDDNCVEPVVQPARGLSVVKGLAAELEGQVCWRFDSLGTTAELSFPKTPSRGAA